MAAPVGNQNAKKAKRWRDAVARALARATGQSVDAGLDKAADIFVAACFGGDLSAIRELGDRFDGKPAQAIVGDDEHDAIGVKEILIRSVTASDRPPPEGG
jgi:hypothetical protein